MPTIEYNRRFWSNPTSWKDSGEEWSTEWGGSDIEWWGTIFPRIHLFVPTNTILEIGSGFGRWAFYLRNLCEKLVLVDLSDYCIEKCKARFLDSSNIEYYVNDGKSLAMIPDQTVDFVFSFDSLVHADEEAIESYVNQISSKLRKDGVAFVHHSNIGKYLSSFSRLVWDIAPTYKTHFKRILSWAGLYTDHGRARTMTAQKFLEYVEKANMRCISQEYIAWESKFIDCISVITLKGSIWERPNRLLRNKGIKKDVKNLGIIAELYGRRSFGKF
jgi:SAM-dependent methyltransferase